MAAPEKEKRQQAAALQIEFSIFVLVPKGPQRNFSQNQKQCSFHGSGTLRSELVLHSLTGRGRSGGRAVRERGRMRKRGPSGGGTLRRESPQQGQWPSPPRGAVASARSQRPRAAHRGLIHCTVKPGKNCIFSPSVAAKLRPIPVRPHDHQPFRGRDRKSSELPWLINLLAALQPKENRVPKTAVYTTHSGRAGTADVMARILTRTSCGVKRKDYKIL